MRISDWSSDVCSSDLRAWAGHRHGDTYQGGGRIFANSDDHPGTNAARRTHQPGRSAAGVAAELLRWAEPRGGPGCKLRRDSQSEHHQRIRLQPAWARARRDIRTEEQTYKLTSQMP